MLLVISPSKTQNFAGPVPADHSLPEFLAEIEILVGHLQGFERKELADLMDMSEKLADLNWSRYQNFSRSFNVENARPAILAFQGDVYSGIRAGDFSRDDLAFAQKHLRIISGLYGLLKPLDLIQPYRLEMKTKLRTASVGNLYEFWDDKITGSLNRGLTKTDTTLVNLASQEYFKAVRPLLLKGPVLDIVFKVKKNGVYKVIAIHAKRARGMMVRFVIRNRLVDREGLKQFNMEGYSYNGDLSSEFQWVFCKE